MKSSRCFADVLNRIRWNELTGKIYSITKAQVELALHRVGEGHFADFLALLSPAARDFLPEMEKLSQRKTRQRFGNIVQFFVPLYVSNECQNICTYCGFSFDNKIARITLSDVQLIAEANAIRELGFEHVLLVSGEASKTVGVPYFQRALELLRPHFSQISMEVQPLEEKEYEQLSQYGLYAVLVYQETYNIERYREYHPKGKKANFQYRLSTPERLGRVGIHKIGLGALLGLEDWRVEAAFLGLHLDWLEKKYWRSRFSVSFPRLRPASGAIEPRVIVGDQDLLQLVCALRLFNENVELSLSTRESIEFRDQLAQIAITSMSAESKTEPGGYALKSKALKQFEICDDRSVQAVAAVLRKNGLEPVWKDWEAQWQYTSHISA